MTNYYFTGKPCSRGHVAKRFTSNGHCVECHKENARVRQGYSGKRADYTDVPKLPGESTAERWWRLNADKNRVYEQNRRARLRQTGGILSGDIVEKLMSQQDGKCVYCSTDLSKTTPQIDHILPLALGGPNTDDNVQLLCRPCNSSKWKKHPDDFIKERNSKCAQS